MDLATLARPGGRIVLVVIDGLGGYASPGRGTELEEADTPHLDRLAAEGVTGLVEPVGAGITPGSGPGHLALFGLDPVEHELGRGLLTAAGIGVELAPGDVAARGNLCTLAHDGTVADRRAGRLDDEPARKLAERLDKEVAVDGVEVRVHHVRGHRVLLVLRGDGLDPRIEATDPQRTGVPPQDPAPLDPAAERTADMVRQVSDQARSILEGEAADGVLLRGFETHRPLPSMRDRYGLRAAAVADYPMYRGLARLVGMEIVAEAPLDEAPDHLARTWDDHDFFFVHHKAADAAGEDGDRDAKIAAIEAADTVVPRLRDLGPDVIVVSGDHSSPPQFAAHSWHPVPTLVWNGDEHDEVDRFGERWCRAGALGRRPTVELLPIALAMAGRLAKYGA